MEKYMDKNYKYKIFILFFSLFFVSPSYSSDNNQIKNNFLVLLEKEFLNNKIYTKRISGKNKFLILDLEKNEYLISFNLLQKNINQNWLLIPTLKTQSLLENISLSYTRSLTFERDADLLEIEAMSKMLVDTTIQQLKKNGVQFRVGDEQIRDKTEKKLNIAFNYFNSCENNLIIEIMEKEFPGFIHLETSGFNSPTKTQIFYFTTSTKYKIKKWIELIMYDFNFNAKDFFIKIYKSKIDINKTNDSKYIYACE